jgi:aryl-alcohol dehydrogenase-like predicted oxidoreductase
MKTYKLGTNGPDITAIGFGTWEAGGGWGSHYSDEQAVEAMRAGFDAGINWVDTAEVYGDGRSEELVGEALAGRDDIHVFTKVIDGRSGLHRDGVRAGCEGSLKRLGVDVIDLYQIHWPSRRVPIEETWEAMAELVDDGLVRWIGVSNFKQGLIERCEKIRHVDSLQPHFSMLNRRGRDDLLPFCANNGTGVIAYGPLAFGLLTGAITAETTFEDDDWRSGSQGIGFYNEFFAPGVREEQLAIVDQLRVIAERRGITLPQLALAWAFHQQGVTGAIAGSRSPKHVVENAEAGSVDLSQEVLDEIEKTISAS